MYKSSLKYSFGNFLIISHIKIQNNDRAHLKNFSSIQKQFVDINKGKIVYQNVNQGCNQVGWAESNKSQHFSITLLFIQNYNRLSNNCRNRLVIENDDKLNCWSVKQLIEDFYPQTNIPITFDYSTTKNLDSRAQLIITAAPPASSPSWPYQ